MTLTAGFVLASSSLAAPEVNPACVRGSWVANTAEAQRLVRRLLPPALNMRVQRGALSATFVDGKLVYGGYSLVFVAGGGANEIAIKSTVDIIAKAPYRVSGNRLVLGSGKYKLHYLNVVVSLNGSSKVSRRPPDVAVTSPGGSVPFTCSGGTLRWKVPLPLGSSGTWLTFQRDRS